MDITASPPQEAPARPATRSIRRTAASWGLGDILFRLLCQTAASTILLILGLLIAVLVWRSSTALTTIGISFLTNVRWDPVDEPDHRVFGALAFVWGTVVTSMIAMLIAVPLGVGTAAFLSEIAGPRLRKTASFFIEMLAAIPSVVYGFWGITVLAPLLQRLFQAVGGPNTGGLGLLAAGLILSIMIVPYIAAISYDVCQAVPRSQREGSLALGATRWQTIRQVVLPYARPGIIGGCFLALGRALGETMAVTMLIGNKPEIQTSIFALGDSIASVIANQFVEASYVLYRSVLIELGLVLLLVTIVVNTLARVLIWKVGQGEWLRSVSRKTSIRWDSGRDVEGETAPLISLRFFKPRVLVTPHQINWLMTGVLATCVATVMSMLVLILTYLLRNGIGHLSWSFFTELPVGPTREGGGMANGILGSLELVGLATLFAVPIGLLAAIYLAEYRSNLLSASVRFVGELLGGVPSIIIGIFAAAVFETVSIWHEQAYGSPLQLYGWSGVFALAVLMVPIVMRAAEEAIKVVPRTLRDASYALGATHAQTVLRITVPAALPAIMTAIFLSIARVAGETAPLLVTAGFNSYYSHSLADFTPSLPVYIFKYAGSAFPNQRDQAWAAAFVLMTLVMVLNFGVRLVTHKRMVAAVRGD